MAKTPIPKTSPLQSRKPLKEKYAALIALPCCNEMDSLPETLLSLEKNSAQLCAQTLIIVNVNQRVSMDRRDNEATLDWLHNFDTDLHVAWLDHVSDDAAYPEKFGVGLARHQACTTGLPFLNDDAPVISLDADSPVNSEYLAEIFSYLRSNPKFKAGHVNFKHRHCGSEAEKQAIEIYERHLHRHRQRLEESNSPHAWYAIGSTIVCKKEAYLKSGGYHCRKMAGEDFYLIQQLSKTGCKIAMIEKAVVYPSDRISDRVPFGTGKAVGEIIENREWLTYHDNCYRDLGLLLIAVERNLQQTADVISQNAPASCRAWLQERKFADVWPKLQANASSDKMLLQRFHEWLDAFQTLKLIHYLSDEHYPRPRI
ncbi:MAG: hypothetical protein AB8B55_01790 [Mariniblastus sp.]